MEYKQFEFRNFKGIQHLVLPLNRGATTLIGLNESGKTTILEAIFCFSYGAEAVEAINPGMAPLRSSPAGWIPVSQRGNFNEPVSIMATVSLNARDKIELREFARSKFGLSLSMIPTEIEIKEHYGFVNSRYEKAKSSKTWNIAVNGTKGQQRLPRPYGGGTAEWKGVVNFLKTKLPRIWYFPDFLFELPERFDLSEASSSSDGDGGDGALGGDSQGANRNRFYKATFQNILEEVSPGADLKTHIVERLRSGEKADMRSLDALLHAMAQLVTEKVFDGWNRIFGYPPAAQEVQIVADFESDGRAGLELKIRGIDGYYELSERSLGFRWFFMYLLMTSFQKKTKNGPKPLILLDEPASNLHSSAQSELLKSFESLIEECNIVYTTHSHHLINIRWLDSSYVVKNNALEVSDLKGYLAARTGSRTSIDATRYRKFVNENPDETSYIQPVLDVLHYRPAALELAPSVVFVEGKSDCFILSYLSEVVGLSPNLRLVPGGGAGSLEPLIRLYIGWGAPFLILLDGDAEGKKQAARYVQEFGPFIAEKCITLPDLFEDEKVVEVEDLLTSQDKDRIVAEVLPEVDRSRKISKKAVLQAILELYARKLVVEIDQATLDLAKAAFVKVAETLENMKSN